MFGMILKFQALMEQLKQNKRLWFTTLTALSLLGIFGTLSYLNSTTSRAAKELYEATNVNYFQDLDSKLTSSFEKIAIFGNTLLGNQTLMAAMNNPGNTAAIQDQLNAVASEVNAFDKSGMIVECYDKNGVKLASSDQNLTLSTQLYDSKALRQAIDKNEFASAIEYQDGGVYLMAYFPLQNSVLATKKPIDYLVEEYANGDKIFQVLMDKDFLDMKNVQKYVYKKINKSEISFQNEVDEEFVGKLADVDFDQVIEEKYIIKDDYFILAKPIVDVDNKKVGVILISELTQKENSLPNMTHSITTGITTAALGLVVALLVLMV